jgi:hypothetical protein
MRYRPRGRLRRSELPRRGALPAPRSPEVRPAGWTPRELDPRPAAGPWGSGVTGALAAPADARPATAAPALSPLVVAAPRSGPSPGSTLRRRGRRSLASALELVGPASGTSAPASSAGPPAEARPPTGRSDPPATASRRTRRLVTGGDPGRVSPIFGFGGGGTGGPSVRTCVTSAASSASSSSDEVATATPAWRLRPPREPRRRRRETLVTAPSWVIWPSWSFEVSGAPLPLGAPGTSSELSGPTGAQSRGRSSNAGFSSPSRPNVAGSELALPAAPSTGSDIETFPSKQARSGARRAHVATRTPRGIPDRAAGSRPRAVTPYR